MTYLSKLLIKNVEIISAPDNEKYFLGIDNDTISVISKEMPTGFENAEIINASDKIAVPGLVNTHTHAAMTLLRSYADDMVLMDWLQNKIWPAEAGLNDEDIYWGTMLSIAEMLKTGTTCFADMYFAMDKVAQAVNETGIRASLSRGLVGLTPDADEKLQDNEMLFKNWHGKADGRIRVMFGPHAPYTCPVSYLKKVVAKAIANGGTIPPIITAAMISLLPVANEAVPNTYAALLNGPPISIAIIPPRISPRMILLELPMEVSPLFSAVLIPPMMGSTTNSIRSPMIRIPTTG